MGFTPGPGQVVQSVLAPAGAAALSIASLWQLMLWTAVTVFSLTMVLLFAGVVRGLHRNGENAPPAPSERGMTRAVASGVALTVLILVGLLVASVFTGRTVAAQPRNAVNIDVSGHQWWWEVKYPEGVADQTFTTANEIHVPIGRPVVLKVESRDVIHSFWVPNLQGKRDLIPGYTTAIWLQADRQGRFRGQCAEFCGKQHAHMAFEVVAEPDDVFESWRAHMREPARDPPTAQAAHGRDLFMRDRCAGCHTVRGTDAGGLAGPDLTHLASRQTIAAGMLPNTASHLADWITRSQDIKPYNQMPPTAYSRDALDALVVYLQSLQ